jgi:hypothetical protein
MQREDVCMTVCSAVPLLQNISSTRTMKSSKWLENIDDDIISPAIPSLSTNSSAPSSSRRKFGTVLSSNSIPSNPPHKEIKKDPPKKSSRAKNTSPSLPQILQQSISAHLGSPLLQNLRTLLLRCDRNEFPASINGFILPTPTEVDFLELLLALQFQLTEKSLILQHDLVCLLTYFFPPSSLLRLILSRFLSSRRPYPLSILIQPQVRRLNRRNRSEWSSLQSQRKRSGSLSPLLTPLPCFSLPPIAHRTSRSQFSPVSPP